MKLYFLFSLCFITLFCEAQKVHFKKNEFSFGLEATLPFTDLKKYNKIGVGVQFQFTLPKGINKSTGLSFAISGHKFKNSIVPRDTSFLLERRPLNNARFLDLTIGIQKIFLKKIVIVVNGGIAFTNVNSSDAPQFSFFAFKPSISYRIHKHFDVYSIFHLGRAIEDDFIFQNFGLKYIF
jgi:hypothetical protein